MHCFHCGIESKKDTFILFEGKNFCCDGCKTVYTILAKNELCNYYELSTYPGISQNKNINYSRYKILDEENTAKYFIKFENNNIIHACFTIPQIHCSSCIWLLEHLNKINKNIISSQINFETKELSISFNKKELKLSEVATIISDIGYEPELSMNDIYDNKKDHNSNSMIYKIGISGFCLGNIMMLSFPEYLSDGDIEPILKSTFNYIILALSLPVFFYCSTPFYKSAINGIKHKYVHVDLTITIALFMTFFRSCFEILTNSGTGFMDALAGIVFFMLVGRYLQDKTLSNLKFDRDYKAYFPIAITKLDNNKEITTSISEIKLNDNLIIKNQEIIPTDSILLSEDTSIDYSFVTGEYAPIKVKTNEQIYAGGKLIGKSIIIKTIKDIDNSYLTKLWNNDIFNSQENDKKSYINSISFYFTIILFSLTSATATYWYFNDISKIWTSVSAMLIIACPCLLLLASNFTNINVLSILSKDKCYLKNASIIEKLTKIDTIIFDKTGTITIPNKLNMEYHGDNLSKNELSMIYTLAKQSSHPYSIALANHINISNNNYISFFSEKLGEGIEGIIDNNKILLGSSSFINKEIKDDSIYKDQNFGYIFISINNIYKGFFKVKNIYRKDINNLISRLKGRYKIAVLSGDNDSERNNLRAIFGDDTELRFKQSPQDKMDYISTLQKQGRNVMMIGDGLNDSGALKQSNVGIAISDQKNSFSPSSDIILNGNKLIRLDEILKFTYTTKKIIISIFIYSLLYNIIGLIIAAQGNLSPVIAAILMPVSSISIIMLSIIISNVFKPRYKHNNL